MYKSRDWIAGFALALFSVSSASNVFAQTSAPDSVKVRAECRKGGTGGCTAHINNNVSCKAAPAGWVIHVDSIRTGSEGAKGKQIICRHEVQGTRTVKTFLGNTQFATKICVRAHIESGGGGGRIGTVFYNKCISTYNIVKSSTIP